MTENKPPDSKQSLARWVVFCVALVSLLIGFALRRPALETRMMHVDEAVQAFKAWELYENGDYHYNPREYHGPTLYYLTQPLLWFTSPSSIAHTNTALYRSVTLVFGLLLVLSPFFMQSLLGRWGASISSLFLAISMAFVFYSSYYIQEMLFVLLTSCCIMTGWQWFRTRKKRWAVVLGVSLGLMHATKETFYLFAFSAALAYLWEFRWAGIKTLKQDKRNALCSLAWVFVPAIITSLIFYTHFLTRPAAVLDIFSAIPHFFTKSYSQVQGSADHYHPWYWYGQLLLNYKQGQEFLWTEAFVVMLGLFGIGVILRKRADDGRDRFLRFIAKYTIVITVCYCLIPYKTPWLLLNFYFPLILCAGAGSGYDTFIKRPTAKNRFGRFFAVGSLFFAMLSQCVQTLQMNERFLNDERNPYFYAHTVMDIELLAQRVHDIAGVHPDGLAMPVLVFSDQIWPLPWYLRDFENLRGSRIVPELGDIRPPLMILAPEFQDMLPREIRDSYTFEFYGLQVGRHVIMAIHPQWWEQFIESRKLKTVGD